MSMTNKEILERIIQKAIGNGWAVFDHFDDGNSELWELAETRNGFFLSLYTDLSEVREGRSVIAEYHAYEIIFNHDFARALWGEDIFIRPPEDFNNDSSRYTLPNWQYHLQQMVISEDPIKYLEENAGIK